MLCCLDQVTHSLTYLLTPSLTYLLTQSLAFLLNRYQLIDKPYLLIKASKDEEYRPLCDIDDQISCSAVFTSKYARGFGQVS